MKYWFLGIRIFYSCNICRFPCQQLICNACLYQLELLAENSCNKCQKPLTANQWHECPHKNYAFDNFYCNLRYANPIKKLLHLLKYQKKRNLAYFLGYLLYHTLYEALDLEETPSGYLITKNSYDVIIPMPLHKIRQKERGFNQAEILLYYYLFKTRHVENIPPVDNKIVKRIRNTKPQALSDHMERQNNLDNAFTLLKPVSGLKILLVDDVVTTGSSMNIIAKLLKQNGASIVDICSLLRTI